MQSIRFALWALIFLFLAACKQGGTEAESQTTSTEEKVTTETLASGEEMNERELAQERSERISNEVEESTPAEPYKPETVPLNYLVKYAGQYPSTVNFLGNEVLRVRMKLLLGENLFSAVQKLWKQETLIEAEGGYIFTSAQAGPGSGDPKVAVMVDIEKDILYVGVKNVDKNEDKIYAERNAEVPVRLKNWAKK